MSEQTPDIEAVLAEAIRESGISVAPFRSRIELAQALAPRLTAAVREAEQRALRLTQHLVTEVVDGGGWCHLSRPDGSRCKEPDVAVRWEDGFMDVVCEHHAETARERGALVVYPKRHDGDFRADRITDHHEAADSGEERQD